MNVNGVNAGAVNWEAILSQLGDVQKTEGADGKELFTITTNVDGEMRTMTVGIPDDLELPETIDAGTLDSLVSKLETSGLGFTQEQISQMKDAIAKLYNAGVDALAGQQKTSGSRSASSILYDIYALMALMIEVAQSQRDAAREMRTSQNLAVQASIQAQADQQRQAAWTGMVVGIVCGVVGAAVSVGLLLAQGTSAKQQAKIMQESGADAAKLHSTMLQNTDNPQAANKALANTQQKVGDMISSKVNADFSRQMNEVPGGNVEAKLDSAMQAHDAAKLEVTQKEATLETAKDTLSVKMGEKNSAQSDYAAKTNIVEQKQQALDAAKASEAKKNNFFGKEAGTADVKKAEAELNQAKTAQAEAKAKLDNATNEVNAKNDIVANAQRDLQIANDKLATSEQNLKTARGDYQKTVSDVAAQYAERYEKAVEQSRSLPDGMTKAEADANVASARNELEMAYAKEAQLLSKEGALTPSEQKDLTAAARTAKSNALHEVFQRTDFKAAESRMNRLMAWNGVSQAFWGTLNQVGQGLSGIQSADATAQGGETQREQEMLDQTKDLFQQEQKLIDQVVQLCQSVIQAENQSMRDAIQA